MGFLPDFASQTTWGAAKTAHLSPFFSLVNRPRRQ